VLISLAVVTKRTVEQPLYNAHVQDWVTVLSLSLVQEFGTISQPHCDKLFPPLRSKDITEDLPF